MPRLLAELLREQQEPFALDVYLLERGYLRTTRLKQRRRQCALPDCSKFLRNVIPHRILKKVGEVADRKPIGPVSEKRDGGTEQSNIGKGKGESTTPKLQSKSKLLAHSGSYDQYIVNKRTMKQTKQLLVDCVREVIEYRQKRDGREQHKNQKIAFENIWQWSQESINESNIVHMLSYGFSASAGERSDH